MRDQLLMRRVNFVIGEGAFGTPISERVSETFLAFGNILAAKNIEQLDRFEVGRPGLFHNAKHAVVSQRFRNEHRHVAAYRRKSRERLERFFVVPSSQQQIKIEFGQKNWIAKIVTASDSRNQLSHFSESIFAEGNRRRFDEQRGNLVTASVADSPNTKLLQKRFQDSFKIEDVVGRAA